jgi:hypothetical protein
MEPLTGFGSYFGMFAAAIISGAIGGFAFELMPAHSECHMGLIKIPNRSKRKDGSEDSSFDLGFLSSLLLGAVTAVAFLYFFPPETQTVKTDATGITTTSYSYDLVKLVALSLIVGSAGPSFLSSIQGRLAGALNEQRQDIARATNEELDKVNKDAVTKVTAVAHEKREKVEAVIRESAPRVTSPAESVVSGNGNGKPFLESDHAAPDGLDAENLISKLHAICDSAEADLKQQIDVVVEDAKKSINQRMGLN